MPSLTKTFNYTGTVQEATILPGTQSIDIYLWGGGGGGGGPDDNPGGHGASGGHVKHLTYAISSAQIGTAIKVAVGGAGAGGSSGGGAPGGTNGKGLTDYSGGVGGSAGPRPYSGGGGGGGGATIVSINGTVTHVAAGGGGGAGAGNHSGSTPGINSNSATSRSPGTLGENGAGHSGDGGGGGAGGGGANGGKGGSGGSGDNSGSGGYSGSNLTQTGGSTSSGSARTPGGTGESQYQSGVGVGGNPAGTGGNGLAVLVFDIGVQAKTKVSGTWKDINNIYTKVSGSWKQITAGYYKVSGTWKALFNSGIIFISNAAGFGNPSGNAASGLTGSGGGGCFIAGTPIMMTDGTTKPVEQVDIGDEVLVGGPVFATGKFLIDNLYEYKGIQVSGTHMVKEDGKWTRVEDSKHGKSLGDDDHIVHVFGSAHRRIMINGIEFTDYFELSEQEELINHGSSFFNNWQDHDRQVHDKNVNIMNA